MIPIKRVHFPLTAMLLLAPCLLWAAESSDSAAAQNSPWAALARGRVEPAGGIIKVAASREGIVKAVIAKEGDFVTQGSVLATLEDRTERLKLALAQSEAAEVRGAIAPLVLRRVAAEREIQRLEQLVGGQLANAQDLDLARDRLAEINAGMVQAAVAEQSASARVALAQNEVDSRTVCAPVAGQVVRQWVRAGEAVGSAPGNGLFWLASDGPPVVLAELDEDSVSRVRVGQAADIITESTPSQTVEAKVQKIGLIFGPQSSVDAPGSRQDERVVECVLAMEKTARRLIFGQRVLVRIHRVSAPRP